MGSPDLDFLSVKQAGGSSDGYDNYFRSLADVDRWRINIATRNVANLLLRYADLLVGAHREGS